jgi:ABC-type multidrug transport system fused ATPase/permease subunit
MENTGSTFGDFAIFITVITFTEKVLSEFLRTIRQITRNFSAVEQLWSTFDALTPIRGYSTGSDFKKHNKDIIIDSISYGYNESKVFSDFSLTIKQ